MLYRKMMSWGLLVSVAALAGCSQQAAAPPTAGNRAPQEDEHSETAAHSHGAGPNGGVIFDLGKYHAEFTVDHAAEECTVLFVNDEGADAQALPVAATEFTLSIQETQVKEGADAGKVVPPMTITLEPVDAQDGKAAKFVGSDPGIANVADFAGTVTGVIDGKPSQGEFQE